MTIIKEVQKKYGTDDYILIRISQDGERDTLMLSTTQVKHLIQQLQDITS